MPRLTPEIHRRIEDGDWQSCELIKVIGAGSGEEEYRAGFHWTPPRSAPRAGEDSLAWKDRIIARCDGLAGPVSWWIGTGGPVETDARSNLRYVPVEELKG